MASPPDLLGFALSQINARNQQRSQRQQDQREQDRFELQMRRIDEQRKDEAFQNSLALVQAGTPVKAVIGRFGDRLGGGDIIFLEEEGKLAKQRATDEANTPTESAQQDIVGGAAARMQQDPLQGTLGLIRSLQNVPEPLSNVIAQRAQGVQAQNVQQQGEFDRRQQVGTDQGVQQFGRQQAISASRDTVNVFVPPEAAAPGMPPGFNTIVGRDRANKIIAGSGGLIREVPLSLTGTKPEDIGLSTPAATRTKLADKLGSLVERRVALQRVGENYDPRFLDYFGQASATITNLKSKLRVTTTEEERKFSADMRLFKSGVGSQLMGVVLEVAATTFSDRLVGKIKEWNLNEDLSDPEFRSLYQEIWRETDNSIARTIYAIKHDPVAGAEYFQQGELSQVSKNRLHEKYSGDRLEKIKRQVEARAVEEAIAQGLSDIEASAAGRSAIEREFYTQPTGGQ